jgi:hypothetical protein
MAENTEQPEEQRVLSPEEMRQELSAIGREQQGLITRSQLRVIGYSDSQIKRLAQRGHLDRVRPSVFAIGGAPDTWVRGLRAVTLCVGDEAFASHSSGSKLWTFCQDLDVYYEVSVPRSFVGEVEGVGIHRTSHLDERDLTVRAGVPCTTYERTLCDCTTRYSPFQLGRILDDGLRRHVMTLKRLRDCAERIESGPGRHMSVIRALLGDRDASYDPGGSDKELDVLAVLKKADLPLPRQQFPIRIGNRVYRPDYAWPEVNAFAEYYGLPWHIGASAVIRDSKRVTALSTAGWMPLIFTKAATEAEIIESVAAALARPQVGRDLGA